MREGLLVIRGGELVIMDLLMIALSRSGEAPVEDVAESSAAPLRIRLFDLIRHTSVNAGGGGESSTPSRPLPVPPPSSSTSTQPHGKAGRLPGRIEALPTN